MSVNIAHSADGPDARQRSCRKRQTVACRKSEVRVPVVQRQ